MFDVLPVWAALTLKSAPFFGSEGEEPSADGAAGATVTDPPADEPDKDKPVNINPDDHIKLMREKEQTDAQLAALQQEKQEREEADEAAKAATRSKEENQAKAIEDLTKDNHALTLVNEANLMELAVLKNKKFEWVDHTVVQKLIDKSSIKIDVKTGKVDGVDEALKALAKESPYLLKKSEGDGDGNSNGNGAAITPGNASGGTPNGNKDASAKANKRAEVIKRFNVLNV